MPKTSSVDIEKEVKTIRKTSKRVRSTKKSARDFLVKHGYFTKAGKLSKRYG